MIKVNFMSNLFFIKSILLILVLNFPVSGTKCQVLNFGKIDSTVKRIEADDSLNINIVVIDTAYFMDNGERLKLQDEFKVYRSSESKKVRKIVWNRRDGSYYDSLILYYKNGNAIKGVVAGKFRRTDTNPEITTTTSFYIKMNKVYYRKKLNTDIYINGSVYLSAINDYIKIARIKLK
jgi:hypothetical protein